MNAKCRVRKFFLVFGVAATLLFLAATIGHAYLLFFPESIPNDGGFSNVALGWMGIAIYGTMLLLSIAALIEYFVEYIAIDGSSICIRTLFGKRKFDLSEIRRLKWKRYARTGKLVFDLNIGKARIELDHYCLDERLCLIRFFHNEVAEENQTDWPLFCYRVAVPLRDGSRREIESNIEGHESDKDSGVLITRRRYDRLFGVALPLCVVAAGVVAWKWGNPRLLALPLFLAIFWPMLRYDIPPEGRREPHVTATQRGRLALLTLGLYFADMLVWIGTLWIGVHRDIAWIIGFAVMLPSLPVAFFGCYRLDKERKRKEQVETPLAVAAWDRRELAA
jgi:hypothetical protein